MSGTNCRADEHERSARHRQLARCPLLAAGLLAAAMLLAMAPGSARAETAQEAQTAPVVVDGRVLFELRGVSSYPAERRAAQVREQILELARTPSFDPASLTVAELPRESRVVAAGRPVLRLIDADAEPEGIERRLLAEVYAVKIREAVVSYRAARTREALAGSAWRVALATVLALLLVLGGRRLIVAVEKRLERRLAERTRGVTIGSFEVVRAERIREGAHAAQFLVRAVALFLVVYLYLGYTLALLPWTRGAASQLEAWLVAPLAVLGKGLVAKLPDLIFLAVLFLVVRWALALLRMFFAAAGRGEVSLGEFEPEWADPTYKLVRVAVIVFALVVAYPYIPGSSSDAFKGISVFLGLLLSLGSSSTVANVIAGYTMIYRRAFHVGDVVKIADVVGVVGRTYLQVTHLRTLKNEDVTFPNSLIIAQEVMNFSTLAKREGLILHTTVRIGYETPWRQIEAMLLEAAARTPGLLADPKPFVLLLALAEFAVTYELNVYCDEPRSMRLLYAELHRRILDVFNEYGVQIMVPAYEGDPAEPKIVPRESWHLPPASRD